MNEVLTFNQVSRIHNTGTHHVVALDQASFTVTRGEFVAVMGQSGSGKSTLLNLAGALDLPTTGTVHVAGQCTGEMSLKQRAALRRRSIGYVFQDYNLLPQLTVAQNIAFPLELDGMPSAKVRSAVADVMERVEIADLGQRLPSQLSGGQAQRAAIARALVGERSLLLADEPTGALDATTGMSVIDLLAQSVEQGATVLMVTHQPTYAAYADRTIFLRDGRIIDTVGSDDLDQLLAAPGACR